MNINVNLGSKIKDAIEENKPTLIYLADMAIMLTLGFCIGYTACASDIVKNSKQ